jgi:hypothetical protein
MRSQTKIPDWRPGRDHPAKYPRTTLPDQASGEDSPDARQNGEEYE